MFRKSRLLLLIGLGLVSFGLAFGISMLTASPEVDPNMAASEDEQTPDQDQATFSMNFDTQAQARSAELTALIREVRAKLAECRERERELDRREKRLILAQEDMDKQAKELEELRVRIVAPLARLKEIQQELKASRVSIGQEELANLRKIAQIYQSKDSVAAAETIVAMYKNNQQNDAVRILYFMSERSAGKVLSEIEDRALVADIYEQMKRIRTEG